MATDTEPRKPKVTSRKAESPKAPLTERDPLILAADADVAATTPTRLRQHPALYGDPAVEVAERTIDHDEEPTSVHVKDFTVQASGWEIADKDAVHERNKTAVRQYMVNQGIRPDNAKVEFVGEKTYDELPGSVVLRYSIAAVPAATAREFDIAHVVIPDDGPTATERAIHDSQREERIYASRDALRVGSPAEQARES